jgi:DNA replicative helicase MCM subunit Mcm2 (Cdc46/Mcm family)
MDDGENVYRVLRRLYSDDQHGQVGSLCEEERYSLGESRLQRAGKKQKVYRIIHRLNVLKIQSLVEEANKEDIKCEELDGIIMDLKARGLIYEPEPGFVGCAVD